MMTILMAPITFALFLLKVLWTTIKFSAKFAFAILWFVTKCVLFITVGWIIMLILLLIGIGK